MTKLDVLCFMPYGEAIEGCFMVDGDDPSVECVMSSGLRRKKFEHFGRWKTTSCYEYSMLCIIFLIYDSLMKNG